MENFRFHRCLIHLSIIVAWGGVGGTQVKADGPEDVYLDIPQLPTQFEVGAGVSAFQHKLPSILLRFSSSGQTFESQNDAYSEITKKVERAFRIDAQIEVRANEEGVSVPFFEAEIYPYESLIEIEGDTRERDGLRFEKERSMLFGSTYITRDVDLGNEFRIQSYLVGFQLKTDDGVADRPGKIRSEGEIAVHFIGPALQKFSEETHLNTSPHIGGDLMSGEVRWSVSTKIGKTKLTLDLLKANVNLGDMVRASYQGGFQIKVDKLGEVFGEYLTAALCPMREGDIHSQTKSTIRTGIKVEL